MAINPLGFVLPAAAIGLGALLVRPQRGFFPTPGQTPPKSLPVGLIPQITEEEISSDRLVITSHPVEQNAPITDHAYKMPEEVIIHCSWSNSPSGPSSFISQAVGAAAAVGGSAVRTIIGAAQSGAGIAAAPLPTLQSVLTGSAQNQIKAIYAQLLALQAERTPFDIFTGKRKYTSMLFEAVTCRTEKRTENILAITLHCKQIIIVATTIVAASAINPNPSAQADPAKTQPEQNEGAKSLVPVL